MYGMVGGMAVRGVLPEHWTKALQQHGVSWHEVQKYLRLELHRLGKRRIEAARAAGKDISPEFEEVGVVLDMLNCWSGHMQVVHLS
jgi:hypothetical protein